MATRKEISCAAFNYKIQGNICRDYYVYSLCVKSVPFYIGVGTKGRDRHLDHFMVSGSNTFLNRKLSKLRANKTKITINIVYCSNDRDRVNEMETRLIAQHKRRHESGTLCNLTPGGDGGDTLLGRVPYYRGSATKYYKEGKQPYGWKRGHHKREHPKIVCHNPTTGMSTRVHSEKEIPLGYIRGGVIGIKSGPTGKIIISNKVTGENRWIHKTDAIPKGWSIGRSCGSTAGTRPCYDPDTHKMRWLKPNQRKPNGWKYGLSPSKDNGGKAVMVNGKKFPSIISACENYGVSRYILQTQYDYRRI